MATAAERLRRARRSAGLSQAQLAARAGTSQPAVNRYERGRTLPNSSTLRRLLGACRADRRPRDALVEHRDEVLHLLRGAGATSVLVFGSVARGEDRPDSDIDLLVDRLDPEAFSWGEPVVKEQLQDLLGFAIDIGTLDELKPAVANDALEDARPL